MKKKKGFTLTELIIVLAIVAILSAIIFPSWAYAMGRARMKSQNNNSKVIFNAAQTAVIRINFQERKAKEETDKLIGSGDFVLYWDGGTAVCAKSASPGSDDWVTNDACTALANQINNIFSGADETVYKVYVKNYVVMSVASGRSDKERYPGSYPTSTIKMDRTTRNKVVDKIENGGIKAVDMNYFTLTPVTPADPAPEEGEGEGEGS